MSNILNLPFWNVTNVKEQSGQYTVDATYGVPPVACVHCGCIDNIHKHGTRPQEIVDVPSHDNRVRIQLVRSRHWCKDCGKTFLQPLPDVADSGSMTKRCVAYIERQSLKHTFAHVAGEVGVDEKTVRNIFNRGLRDTMTATKRREVMRSRFLLLKRAHQLTDEEKSMVSEWTTTLPTLGRGEI